MPTDKALAPDLESRLIHIVISKTVMECAKLAGHASVFDSGWQIPRMEIAQAAREEYLRSLLADARATVAPLVKAIRDNEEAGEWRR